MSGDSAAQPETVELFRPVGADELRSIEALGRRAFPPRLPEQPIFYPVLTRGYAEQIARDWNAARSGVGYVLRFRVDARYLDGYAIQTAGGRAYREYWIPAGELDAFNAHIAGTIAIDGEYRRDGDVVRGVRRMQAADAPFVVETLALPHAAHFVRRANAERVVASLADPHRESYVLVRDGHDCGVLVIDDVATPDRIALLDVLVTTEPGRGDGTWALRWSLARVFETHREHKAWLMVVAGNVRARTLYERHGLQLEGTWRDGYPAGDGTYRDLCLYGILEDEYRAAL